MNSDLVRAADPWINVWTGVTATSSLTSTSHSLDWCDCHLVTDVHFTLSLVWPTVPTCYVLFTAKTVPTRYVLSTAKTVPTRFVLSTAKTVPTRYVLSTAKTVPTRYVLSTAKTVPTRYVLSTAKTVPVTSEPINSTDSHTAVSGAPARVFLSAPWPCYCRPTALCTQPAAVSCSVVQPCYCRPNVWNR